MEEAIEEVEGAGLGRRMQLRDVNITDIGDAIRLGCQIVERVKSQQTARNGVKDSIHAHS